MSALKTPADDAPAAAWGALAVRIPGWQCRPDLIGWAAYRVDPDHWAWTGWLLRLLGNERWRLHLDDVGEWSFWVNGPPETHGTGHLIHVGESLGRACIATAAALGRWPGGGA